jgi:hypothetical protein
MKNIVIVIAALFTLGCQESKLTREKAADLISAHEGFPRDDARRFIMEDRTIYRSSTRRTFQKCGQLGLITFEDFGASRQGGRFPKATIGGTGVKASFTHKGKQYQVSPIKSSGMEKYAMVKYAEINLESIDGIRLMEEETKAIVDFTVQRGNITPFGEIFRVKDASFQTTAVLSKYDDGWRVTKVNRRY